MNKENTKLYNFYVNLLKEDYDDYINSLFSNELRRDNNKSRLLGIEFADLPNLYDKYCFLQRIGGRFCCHVYLDKHYFNEKMFNIIKGESYIRIYNAIYNSGPYNIKCRNIGSRQSSSFIILNHEIRCDSFIDKGYYNNCYCFEISYISEYDGVYIKIYTDDLCNDELRSDCRLMEIVNVFKKTLPKILDYFSKFENCKSYFQGEIIILEKKYNQLKREMQGSIWKRFQLRSKIKLLEQDLQLLKQSL